MIDYKALYRLAVDVRKNAYAPFSGFQVGAALLCTDGTVFTGVNVENSSYGATICAERTAFVKAISVGKRDFKAIAVAAAKGAALPCGVCRQFMYEFGSDLDIITGENEANLTVESLEGLLPDGFRLWEKI